MTIFLLEGDFSVFFLEACQILTGDYSMINCVIDNCQAVKLG